MAKNKNSLDHADHNDKACEFLAMSPYSDWVVTTAFYSSLHYVLYKMFPLKASIGGKTDEFQTFEDYYIEYSASINLGRPVGKHSSITDLVETNIPKIAADYNKLKDISWTARYNDYKVDKLFSREALRLMKKIKGECIDP